MDTPSEKHVLPLPRLRWRGLTLQLFGLVILPLTVLLLLITFGSLQLHQKAMRALVGERDERAARTAASALSEQLHHRAAAIQNLAQRAADGVYPGDILATSSFLQSDFDGGLGFLSSQGDLLISSGDPKTWEYLDHVIQSTQMIHQANGEVAFSKPIQPPGLPYYLVLVMTSAGEGEPYAVGAFSTIQLARRALAGAFTPGEQTAAFLVSQDLDILYQTGEFPTHNSLDNHPGVSGALRGESGTTYLQAEDSEHVIAFSPVSPTRWALIIEEPWESVAGPLLFTTQAAPLILVPVLLLALVALWFGARQVVQPLQALEVRATALAWGDYQAVEESVGGIEEIRRLQRALIHLAQKVQNAQQSLRGYIGAITAGQEEERKRLARELHDDTIQSLVALNQRVQLAQLNLLKRRSSEDLSPAQELEEIQNLIELTISDLRRLTQALRPLYLEDLGLVAALEMLARETSQSSNLAIEFHRRGPESRLSPEEELALFRMAQEGLNNVVRHAQAEHASLSLEFSPQELTLTIADDGRGFEVPESPAEFAPSGHFGLLGLHERAELIGAHMEIHSAPGQGTRLVITLPMNKSASA